MRASVGFVLVDSSFNPVFANEQAKCALNTGHVGVDGFQDGVAQLVDAVRPDMASGALRSEFDLGGRRWKWMLLSNNCCSGGPQALHAFMLGAPSDQLPYTAAVAAVYRLTPRETEAFEALIQGFSVKEVAEKMGINPSTAKTFLRSISGKMGVSSRSEMMSKVLEFGCNDSVQCPFRIAMPSLSTQPPY
jgi:DNA-binding NarL/FixJ family response regulator